MFVKTIFLTKEEFIIWDFFSKDALIVAEFVAVCAIKIVEKKLNKKMEINFIRDLYWFEKMKLTLVTPKKKFSHKNDFKTL